MRTCLGLLAAATYFAVAGEASATNVLTQHNDVAHTGATLEEKVLTTSNVRPGKFGKLDGGAPVVVPIDAGPAQGATTLRAAPLTASRSGCAVGGGGTGALITLPLLGGALAVSVLRRRSGRGRDQRSA